LLDGGPARGFKNLSSLEKMATMMVQSCARVDLEGSLLNSGLTGWWTYQGLEDPDICAIVGSHYKQCLGHINYKHP
jgi:hypothetical protein